jgi:DNA (cytosine-5)-methyltransferase 1
VVDLFCGAGGLTHGFVKEKLKVVAGVDSDGSCKYAYEHNNGAKFIHKKIEDVTAEEIRELYPAGHTKILVGCAPCQPYSTYTKKQSKDETSSKWKLLSSFADLIEAVDPDIVSMENVRELRTFDKGAVYNAFVARLEQKYTVTSYLIYCPDYGVPQKRTRLVLFASKFGAIQFTKPTHAPNKYKTVRKAIGKLPPIEAGQVHPDDPLHRCRGLSELNLKRIQQSRPGGTWRDWDETLIAACHKRDTGASYSSVYGRMKWSEPAPTITTECDGYGNGRFGHPKQHRGISMREAALLQSFPPNYEFGDPNDEWSMARLARHIGNAVPVKLGAAIARSIKEHLEHQHV